MNAIEFENVSKQYRLGLVSTGTVSHDLNRWWTVNVLRKEDPYLKIGEINDRAHRGHSDYVWALKGISFSVEEGDVVGIIGKNGAGKSTLLKILSRITTPTTGEIRIRGRIASLLEVGTGFHPEMTGRENIFLNGAIMGMTKEEVSRKFDEIVDFSGCERYIDTPVKRYSSGMKVRLGFAVAAHLDPEILVVDEVLAVGDAEFQKKAVGKMQDVANRKGRTVLFVSHNMAAVRKLCKSGIILQNGMVHYIGTANEAIDEYLKVYADRYEELPLADIPRTDSTSGLIRFTGYNFTNFNNEPITPHCGKPLRIRLKAEVMEDVKNAEVSMDICNSFGEPMMNFATRYTMNSFSLSKGEHWFNLDIQKLPLTRGTYRLGLWCATKRFDSKVDCADYINNVVKLNVEEDDFFSNGKRPALHLTGKIVLCDHKWEIE